MSQRLRRYSSTLRYLTNAPADISQAIIKGSDPGLMTCLCECAKNILNGNVPLTASQKAKLRSHKTGLRTLANKSVSPARKRRVLQQGGFLGALLAPIAASVLGPIVSGILGGGRR